MVSGLDSGASGQGSSPGRGHSVVFLGKTLYSHSASLDAGIQMDTSKLNTGLATSHHVGSQNIPRGFMYRNRDKLRPGWAIWLTYSLDLFT